MPHFLVLRMKMFFNSIACTKILVLGWAILVKPKVLHIQKRAKKDKLSLQEIQPISKINKTCDDMSESVVCLEFCYQLGTWITILSLLCKLKSVGKRDHEKNGVSRFVAGNWGMIARKLLSCPHRAVVTNGRPSFPPPSGQENFPPRSFPFFVIVNWLIASSKMLRAVWTCHPSPPPTLCMRIRTFHVCFRHGMFTPRLPRAHVIR